MKTVPAGLFKAKCLEIMDEVKARRQPILITKHGKPVAKLVPADSKGDEIFGFLKGKGLVVGDIVSPVLSSSEWGNLK